MLAESAAEPVLLATDLDEARSFYAGRLGLEVLVEDPSLVSFACGGDHRVIVTASESGPSDTASKVSWRVDDIRAEVADLRAREVAVLDLPDIGTVDGIADVGFALAAWITDPLGNSLGILQMKGGAA